MANEKLTWTELRKAMAEYANISEQEAGQFLNALLDGVTEGLKTDKQVKIKGLGSFSLKTVAPRKSVNIATGEEFIIEGYNKLTFNAALARMIGGLPAPQPVAFLYWQMVFQAPTNGLFLDGCL